MTDQSNEPTYSNAELLHLFRWCSHAQRPAHNPHGQNRLLRTLAKCGPMTQRELAEAVQRTPGTLSQQLESMEEAGLVTRAKCADDRRNVLVSLTEQGERAAVEVTEEYRLQADALFGDLNDADRSALGRILQGRLALWTGDPAGGHASARGADPAGSPTPAHGGHAGEGRAR